MTRDAAAVARRLQDAFDEATSTEGGFERVRDAIVGAQSFEDAARRLGGELGQIQLEVVHPEIECDYTGLDATTMDSSGLFRGHAEWIEMWRLWFEPWEWFEWAERSIEPLPDGRALFTAVGRCRGRTSGVTVELPQNGIWTARDGQLVHYVAYDTAQQAREAAGLSEDGGRSA